MFLTQKIDFITCKVNYLIIKYFLKLNRRSDVLFRILVIDKKCQKSLST